LDEDIGWLVFVQDGADVTEIVWETGSGEVPTGVMEPLLKLEALIRHVGRVAGIGEDEIHGRGALPANQRRISNRPMRKMLMRITSTPPTRMPTMASC
jgi:hypothetical protein